MWANKQNPVCPTQINISGQFDTPLLAGKARVLYIWPVQESCMKLCDQCTHCM